MIKSLRILALAVLAASTLAVRAYAQTWQYGAYAYNDFGNGYAIRNNTYNLSGGGSSAWAGIYYSGSSYSGWGAGWNVYFNEPYSTKTYEEMIRGWVDGSWFTNNSGFPKYINTSLTTNSGFAYHTVYSNSGAEWNAQMTAWCHQGNDGGTTTGEIIVWLNDQAMGPLGSYSKTVKFGNQWYNKYIGSNGHPVITYVATPSLVTSISVSWEPILMDAGMGGQYLSGVTCGFETLVGSAQLQSDACYTNP